MARVLFDWTTEHVERARKMWFEGASASQIAHAIGARSRNVVIGKLHRLGLTGYNHPERPLPSTANKRARKHRTPSSKSAPSRDRTAERKRQAMRIGSYGRPTIVQYRWPVTSAEIENEPESRNLTLFELTERTCKWAHTDAVPHLFCGNKTYNSSWCPHHAGRVNAPYRAPLKITDADRQRRRMQILSRMPALSNEPRLTDIVDPEADAILG